MSTSTNNTTKKNVYQTGALGALLQSGKIRSIEDDETTVASPSKVESPKSQVARFATESGLTFNEYELIEVDPTQCEPWQYANRLEDEMGNLQELVDSIRQQGQLQPALIRLHPTPRNNLKYEVIFGRRRHLACLKLNKPFLAILKKFDSDQDAIVAQNAENTFRKDVSNYSNALLYRKLLDNKLFKTDNELAQKLGMSKSSLSDLLSYSKIPAEIVRAITNIHSLSQNIALKIVALLNKDKSNLQSLLAIAPKIGTSINSPAKLEQAVMQGGIAKDLEKKLKVISSADGRKLFSVSTNHQGAHRVMINKALAPKINIDDLCQYLKGYFQEKVKADV